MENWVKWYEQPYAEDDSLLNKFVEDALRRISWRLFENQEDVVYMANETDNGIPKMREGAIDYIHMVARNELGWLVNYMVNRILVSYMKGNIDPSEEVKWWFKEDLPKGDDEQFWKEINEYIWQDYAEVLGEEKTAELWKHWGKVPLED